ncbi:hypothetical protein [Marinobacter sp. S6332]|uniref:hypothetical protein n=1 Tax=Marinobacter sp. S6332 TaxID=2926403 RepID=UPI001FF6C387|nr:hypothetical protein [Marinobacter sp. S6332]MCK0163982.1 hypothetical protein [Marinobacter sp. S6332]
MKATRNRTKTYSESHNIGRLVRKAFAVFAFLLGFILLAINFYGLTQTIRKPGLGVNDHEQLRFIPERVWSYEESINAIDSLDRSLATEAIVSKANYLVNQSLVHIEWLDVDAQAYRQLIPMWENYFLWAIGEFSGLPQFERYHYADYKRNIRRGIGICGDASTVLSSILDTYDIENRIVSFKGHVIVEYENEQGYRSLVDPDFGVEMDGNLEHLVQNPEGFKQYYLDAGYPSAEVDWLFKAYDSTFSIFDDTLHFMTKRYIFEQVSYVMKWLLPILLVFFPGVYLFRTKRVRIGAAES